MPIDSSSPKKYWFFSHFLYRHCFLSWSLCWGLCQRSKHWEIWSRTPWCYHQVWAHHALLCPRDQYWALRVKMWLLSSDSRPLSHAAPSPLLWPPRGHPLMLLCSNKPGKQILPPWVNVFFTVQSGWLLQRRNVGSQARLCPQCFQRAGGRKQVGSKPSVLQEKCNGRAHD